MPAPGHPGMHVGMGPPPGFNPAMMAQQLPQVPPPPSRGQAVSEEGVMCLYVYG